LKTIELSLSSIDNPLEQNVISVRISTLECYLFLD